MNIKILLRVAGPTFVLGVLLLVVGIVAAWNVEEQQRTNSELVAREVHGMLAIEDIFLVMREVRRELDLYLRTHDRQHLKNAKTFLQDARDPMTLANSLSRTKEERELFAEMSQGVERFRTRFDELGGEPESPTTDEQFAELNDDHLTNRVLQRIRACIAHMRQVVDRTTASSQVTARHMRLGFLMLGLTGSAAGLLSGVALARALSRTIVQLDVSIRGVAGKLQEVSSPVLISRHTDLQTIESAILRLESDIQDVVERLQQRELELLRSEQLALVGQLAAGMAHELRNPIMPIKVFVQSALRNYPARQLTEEQLQIICQEVTRLEEAIQSLLDFARPPEPEWTDVDLCRLITDTINLTQPQAARQSVQIRSFIPERRIVASLDAGQIRQLLLNLVLNSLDAMPEGGELDIELKLVAVEPRAASASAISEHDALRLSSGEATWPFAIVIRVLDTGHGFSQEMLDRAFEPFVSSKETGAGLGLSICQRIVAAHGGEIRVANRPLRGAQVEIQLPYQHEPGLIRQIQKNCEPAQSSH